MILVTGTSGFIGRHLLNTLIQKKEKENIVAFTSKPVNNYNYLLHKNYKISPDFFENTEYKNIETVIHTGAFTPKSGAEINRIDQCFSNIESTYNLINALPKTVEHFIFFSTLDVYAESEDPLNEQSQINPASLYAQSKMYCERMIEAWAKEKNKKISILRIGHVYGPGEEAYNKIIPVTIKRLQQKLSPQIWGPGSDLRSFIYIDDVVSMVINSLNVGDEKKPVNIASEKAVSINELVNILIEISGLQVSPEYLPSNAKPMNIVFDNTRMKKLLGREATDLRKGLTQEWNYMLNLK